MDSFQRVTNTTVLLEDLQPHRGKEEVEEQRKQNTVQQLFTGVMSSYFTRKYSHSKLTSWPLSSFVYETFLHITVVLLTFHSRSVDVNASRAPMSTHL